MPRSPWQNAYVERLIGSVRRECVDHVVVFGERHLRHLLLSYKTYYNETRTHLSLSKDAPLPRTIQPTGPIFSAPILGGASSSIWPDVICDRHSDPDEAGVLEAYVAAHGDAGRPATTWRTMVR